jgi:hypothetical protein
VAKNCEGQLCAQPARPPSQGAGGIQLCKESHRDEKSSGFNWQRSQVKEPEHAQRLVLVMALASLLCIAQGVSVLKRGLRYLFEPRRQRQLSVFQLGKRWLDYALVHDDALIPLPSLPPPRSKVSGGQPEGSGDKCFARGRQHFLLR